MSDFTGKFQYLGSGGAALMEGDCRVQFDRQTLTLAPHAGAPLVCDLGDLDAVTAADYEIRLPLYTGNTIVLRQLGRAYDTLAHDLLEAFNQRVLECLLLEDLEEVARFNGNFELDAAGQEPRSGAAEFRLFKSNLAILPAASQGFQWRIADIDSVKFDATTYQVTIAAGPDILKAGKLAKRTEEFNSKLEEAIAALAKNSAQAMHTSFPFLNPDQLQTAAGAWREGSATPVRKLAGINPKFSDALASHAVDQDTKPYFDDLLSRAADGSLYAGFKMIRPEPGSEEHADPGRTRQPDEEEASASGVPDADPVTPAVLYWFFFPIAMKPGSSEPANVAAWEASSASGRATYFFRLLEPGLAPQLRDPARASGALDAAIRRLNRVLGMLNFRRRPIYLSDDELERDPQFHRYAIAARRIPELKEVRNAFLGRALHSSLEAWQAQVRALLAKAGL